MKISIGIPGWVDQVARPGRGPATDGERMALAIALARESVGRGGGPFGAVICNRRTGDIVAGGVNMVLLSGLSLLHAEVAAIIAAQRRTGSYTLDGPEGHELFASSEPCAMCLGAIFWSGVRRVVYGAPGQAAREAGFDEGPVFPEAWDYLRRAGIEVTGGMLGQQAEEILADYRNMGGIIYNP